MTAFVSTPVTAQNFICFWALLVCLGSIAGEILLHRQRRLFPLALAVLCASGSYFILHLCMEGTLQRHGKTPSPFVSGLLALPCAVYLAFLLAFSLICLRLFRSVRVWGRTHVTSASIKESMDGLPAGVCCYLEDGRCVLVNHRMNDICFSLSGRFLQNGAAFYESVKGRRVHALSDGTAVSFRHRVLTFDNAPLHELIADDITELYEKSERLRADNERARQLSADMKAYGRTISDTVRQREILQAKINIHDEMNRMILATKNAAREETSEAERRDILRMWQGQALLLCKEAEAQKSNNVVSDLNALAAVIGMEIQWNGALCSEDPAVLSLFLAAAREALANAAKHAGAKRLTIDLDERGGALCAAFSNDGAVPIRAVEEAGGLRSLRQRLEKAGGQMQVDAEREFRLRVTIPKGGS